MTSTKVTFVDKPVYTVLPDDQLILLRTNLIKPEDRPIKIILASEIKSSKLTIQNVDEPCPFIVSFLEPNGIAKTQVVGPCLHKQEIILVKSIVVLDRCTPCNLWMMQTNN